MVLPIFLNEKLIKKSKNFIYKTHFYREIQILYPEIRQKLINREDHLER